MAKDRELDLLDLVPTDGSGIGNTRLLRELEWDEDEFWAVRNRLVDRGVLELGRGRGGSVRRVLSVSTVIVPTPGTEPPPRYDHVVQALERSSEPELYSPIARVLDDKWTKDKRVESAIVQLTAQQGRRATGGRWTRPDVTVATLSTYPYVPGRHFDVVTFEVKPFDAIDVTCVYEALAHLRSATRSYVLIHVPEKQADDLEETLLEICAEAKKHGIGVITFEAPSEYETWDERVEPVRREPEPRKLNDFLAKQFTQEQLEKIVRWFR
jgi:hypothetical protein